MREFGHLIAVRSHSFPTTTSDEDRSKRAAAKKTLGALPAAAAAWRVKVSPYSIPIYAYQYWYMIY